MVSLPAFTADPFEKECKWVFDSPSKWRNGEPMHRRWGEDCWAYVEKRGSKWYWLGSKATRKKEAERKQLEQKRKVQEEKRRREEAEKKQAEKERKKAERLAQEKKRKLEAEKREQAETERKRKEDRKNRTQSKDELPGILAGRTTIPVSQLGEWLSKYQSYIDQASETLLINKYFVRSREEKHKKSSNVVRAILDTLSESERLEIDLRQLTNTGAKFICLNPKNNSKTYDFSVSFNNRNLPRQLSFQTVSNEDLPTLLHQPFTTKHVVLVNVHSAIAERTITDTGEIESEYRSGTQSVPNPKYRRALFAVQEAENRIADIEGRYNRCLMGCGELCGFCNLGYAIKVKEPRKQYEAAFRRLGNTPPTIEEPVYHPYKFRKSKLTIRKEVLIDYYVINRNGGEATRYRQKISQNSKKFQLLYGLHKKDRNKHSHTQHTTSEEDVLAYEEKMLAVNLSDILKRTINKADVALVSDVTSIESAILGTTPQQKISRQAGATKQEDGELVNKQLRSVLVVLNPGGGIGTAFYVTKDIVLTNYHVIEGTNYLEFGLYDKEDTFGKVIGKDIRLDLALVKVQETGEPLQFYREKNLTVGSTVSSIGHPRGLEFSFTQGTVSAIRRLPSRYDPSGKAIRFIQTDTAISPGNSGGPLFFENTVVGVNTFKIVEEGFEGLNFAVHYQEVVKFLSKHGIE